MRRRDILRTMAAAGIGSVAAGQLPDRAPLSRAQSQPRQWTLAKVRRKLQGNVPDSIVAVIGNMLNDKPESLDTDWNGTFRIEGLLRWSRRGLRETLADRVVRAQGPNGGLRVLANAGRRTTDVDGPQIPRMDSGTFPDCG